MTNWRMQQAGDEVQARWGDWYQVNNTWYRNYVDNNDQPDPVQNTDAVPQVETPAQPVEVVDLIDDQEHVPSWTRPDRRQSARRLDNSHSIKCHKCGGWISTAVAPRRCPWCSTRWGQACRYYNRRRGCKYGVSTDQDRLGYGRS